MLAIPTLTTSNPLILVHGSSSALSMYLDRVPALEVTKEILSPSADIWFRAAWKASRNSARYWSAMSSYSTLVAFFGMTSL